MNVKTINIIDSKTAFEHFLKKNLSRILSITIQTSTSKFTKKTKYKLTYSCADYYNHDFTIKNFLSSTVASSTLYIAGYPTIYVYISSYDNENIASEIDNNLPISLKPLKQTIIQKSFFAIITSKKRYKANVNLGDIKRGVMAYINSNPYNADFLDLFIYDKIDIQYIAYIFKRFLQTYGNVAFSLSEINDFKTFYEVFLDVQKKPYTNLDINVKNVKTNISDDVMEVSCNDDIRIYIGKKDTEYIMDTYGNEILYKIKQENILFIPLPDDIIIKIYQKYTISHSKYK